MCSVLYLLLIIYPLFGEYISTAFVWMLRAVFRFYDQGKKFREGGEKFFVFLLLSFNVK